MASFSFCLVVMSIFSTAVLTQKDMGHQAMIPYGATEGDEEISINHQRISGVDLNKSMSDGIPFYGKRRRFLFVSVNGMISFTSKRQLYAAPFAIPASIFGLLLGTKWSFKLDKGKLYYRVMKRSDRRIRTGAKAGSLETLSAVVRDGVVGASRFEATIGLVVTWEDILSDQQTINACEYSLSHKDCQRDTFQVILLSDMVDTYVIMNYAKVKNKKGLKAFQYAGFYAGDKQSFYSIHPTSISDPSKLPERQGSDTKGRYIFSVSRYDIMRGGCVFDQRLVELSISPKYSPMLGGGWVEVSGPCIRKNQALQLRCKFHDIVVKAFAISSSKARCEVPMLMIRGDIQLAFSLDAGVKFDYYTVFHVLPPLEQHATLHVPTISAKGASSVTNRQPPSLTFTWNPSAIGDAKSLVNINIVYFLEKSKKASYNIINLVMKRPNSGTYTVYPLKEDACHGKSCESIEIGVIQVTLLETKDSMYNIDTTHRSLYSPVIPLSWYTNQQLTKTLGEQWPTKQCKAWRDRDSVSEMWRKDLPSCPCSKDIAKADIGRWLAGSGCNEDMGTPCTFHTEAVHCVRSQPTSQGSSSQCCYTASGDLIHTQDSYEGSTPDRATDDGSEPYRQPGRVPKFSHWLHDVQPFLYCCFWSDGVCDYYLKQRFTTSCRDYVRPSVALVYGDAHIETLDGTRYLMNAYGEFQLASIGTNVTIQGQFDTVATSQTTGLVALAIKTSLGRTVEVRLSEEDAYPQRTYNVFIDGRLIDFSCPTRYTQKFKDVTITVINATVTLHLPNGVGVHISAVQRLMHARFSFPQTTQGSVGLLGYFNGNDTDDFARPNKMIVNQNASSIEIYGFILDYEVTDQKSLFRKKLASEFFDPLFVAPPISKNNKGEPTISDSQIKRVCGNASGAIVDECLFDLIVTGDERLASATREAVVRFTKLRRNLTTARRSCGRLSVPGGIKSTYSDTVGTELTITGCRRDCQLSGNTKYRCETTKTGAYEWSPAVTADCSDCSGSRGPRATSAKTPGMKITKKPGNKLTPAQLAGIIIGAVIVTVIIIAVIVYFIRRRPRTSRRGDYAQDEAKEMKTRRPLRSNV